MNILYDIIHIIPLSVLLVGFFGGFTGMPENSVAAYIICLALLHTGTLTGIPVVGDRHHYSLAQSLVELLRGGLLQGYVIGVLQLCFRPLKDIHAIITHVFTPF